MSEPQIPQKKPYLIKAERTGKLAWCACGLSKNQPFCDSSHKGTGFRPMLVDVEEGQSYLLCGCKHSGNKPICDGTHKNL